METNDNKKTTAPKKATVKETGKNKKTAKRIIIHADETEKHKTGIAELEEQLKNAKAELEETKSFIRKLLEEKSEENPSNQIRNAERLARNLMAYAGKNSIGVCLFLYDNKQKHVNYMSSASLGIAFDMYYSIVKNRPKVACIMQKALDAAKELKAVHE